MVDIKEQTLSDKRVLSSMMFNSEKGESSGGNWWGYPEKDVREAVKDLNNEMESLSTLHFTSNGYHEALKLFIIKRFGSKLI